MVTKILVSRDNKDEILKYDTSNGKVTNDDNQEVTFDGLYAVTSEGKFGLISDKDKIEEFLETYRIIAE